MPRQVHFGIETEAARIGVGAAQRREDIVDDHQLGMDIDHLLYRRRFFGFWVCDR